MSQAHQNDNEVSALLSRPRETVGDKRLAPDEEVEPDVSFEIFEFNEPEKALAIDAQIMSDVFGSLDDCDRADLAGNIMSEYAKTGPNNSGHWLIRRLGKQIRSRREKALERELREGL